MQFLIVVQTRNLKIIEGISLPAYIDDNNKEDIIGV